MKKLDQLNRTLRDLLSSVRGQPDRPPDPKVTAYVEKQRGDLLQRLDGIDRALGEQRTSSTRKRSPGAVDRRRVPNQDEWRQYCTSIPLLGTLREQDAVRGKTWLQQFSPYSLLYQRGDKAPTLLILLQGEVKRHHYSVFEEEILLELSKAPALLGITGLYTEVRTEFCTALQACKVLQVPFEFLRSEVAARREARTLVGTLYRQELIAERLAASGLLKGEELARLRSSFPRFHLKFYKPGEVILAQGAKQQLALHVISRGEVEVSSTVEGTKIVLNRLYEGEYFGEMSLLDHAVPSATVRAVSATELISIDERQMQHLLSMVPEVRTRLLATKEGRARMNAGVLDRAETNDRRSLAAELQQELGTLNVAHLLQMAEREQVLSDEEKRCILEQSKVAAEGRGKNYKDLTLEDFSTLSIKEILEETYRRAKEEIERDYGEEQPSKRKAEEGLELLPTLFPDFDGKKSKKEG